MVCLLVFSQEEEVQKMPTQTLKENDGQWPENPLAKANGISE